MLPPCIGASSPSITKTWGFFNNIWSGRASWEDYAISLLLQTQSQPIQAAHLRRCPSDDMKSILIRSVGITLDSTMPFNDMLALIHSHMHCQRNLTLRRQQYNHCHQQSGQTFEAFYVHLRQLAVYAELGSHCLDTLLLAYMTESLPSTYKLCMLKSSI